MRTFLLLALGLGLPLYGQTTGKSSAGAPTRRSLTVEQVTQNSLPSIVTITQYGRGGEQEALGTGFVIDADGLIATNMHVIGNSRRLKVQTSDGNTHEVISVHATDPNLDLAIIRINSKNLQPLVLGDSDHLKQGQRIVAIGNPLGLTHSVVEGIVSAMREVEENTMLQLAIPIEEGNSGGPVLDRHGRVQGVLTLKSAVTDNLGFAHPVNDLKLLIKHPNPVPMERWLTIGKLNPQTWTPKMGALWTQHAGQVHVEGLGEGFGGRSYCLYKSQAPAFPFEVSVDVKLHSESGAAGLIFCGEGDLHYGFYPSGGRLRLVRFNGPDLFSWTILSEKSTESYLPGRWNNLRVRVDVDKIMAFVNDRLVIEENDSVLRGGRVGLCKFRDTRAAFKGFQLGTNLARPSNVSDDILASIAAEIDSQIKGKSIDRSPSKNLLATPAAARKILQQQARELEQQASHLRNLAQNLHRQDVARQLALELNKPDEEIQLLKAALLVAWHDNPDIDIQASLQAVNLMADELRNDPVLKQNTQKAAQRLTNYLFMESGFHGSRGESIEELSNSYLNEVIDDREGIPLALAIVYLELAHQLGVEGVHGANLPGRFMVFYEHQDTRRYIDVFNNGKEMSAQEMEAFILGSTGQQPTEQQAMAARPRDMVLRLLYNLVSFSKDPAHTLPYLDLILTIDPDSMTERLNRALLRSRNGDSEGARADIEHLKKAAPAGLDLHKIEALYESL